LHALSLQEKSFKVLNADEYPRGKTRLAKWYAPYNDEEKIKLKGEVR
jgi:hypothetical protein